MGTLQITFKPHQYQWQALSTNKRFIAVISGIQGGKTTCGAWWLNDQAARNPKDEHLIAAPSYKILQQSTLKKFFEMFPYHYSRYRKHDSVIDLPEGGHIWVRSTDEPKGLEGMTLKSAWLDEAGQMASDVWLFVQGRLSIHRGRAMLTTTPYNMGWLYRDFYNKFKEGNADYEVVQFCSIDNPYFPQDEFARAKQTLDARMFARRYMGRFERMAGLVYEDFDDGNIIEDANGIELHRVIAGIDWGFTNAAAIAVIGITRDRCYYVLDEFYRTGETTNELKEVALYLRDKHKITRFYADSAEPDRIEEFNRPPRLYAIPAIKNVELGIDKLRQLIKEKRLKVVRSCVHWLDEIDTYHYGEPKDDSEQKEEPVKIKNHLMDATRYVIATYQPEFSLLKNRTFIPEHRAKVPSMATAY